jgi:hypothetical protein
VCVRLCVCVWVSMGLGDLHSRTQTLKHTHTHTHRAGAIWGAIGPLRFFGPGSVYAGCLYGFLVGLLLPLLPWALNRWWWPSKYWRLIHFPILCSIPMAPGFFQSTTLPWFAVAYVTQSYLFRHHHGWWERYNYVLSVAIDSGVGFALLIVSALQVWQWNMPRYWGNPSAAAGLDYYCFGRPHE